MLRGVRRSRSTSIPVSATKAATWSPSRWHGRARGDLHRFSHSRSAALPRRSTSRTRIRRSRLDVVATATAARDGPAARDQQLLRLRRTQRGGGVPHVQIVAERASSARAAVPLVGASRDVSASSISGWRRSAGKPLVELSRFPSQQARSHTSPVSRRWRLEPYRRLRLCICGYPTLCSHTTGRRRSRGGTARVRRPTPAPRASRSSRCSSSAFDRRLPSRTDAVLGDDAVARRVGLRVVDAEVGRVHPPATVAAEPASSVTSKRRCSQPRMRSGDGGAGAGRPSQ